MYNTYYNECKVNRPTDEILATDVQNSETKVSYEYPEGCECPMFPFMWKDARNKGAKKRKDKTLSLQTTRSRKWNVRFACDPVVKLISCTQLTRIKIQCLIARSIFKVISSRLIEKQIKRTYITRIAHYINRFTFK